MTRFFPLTPAFFGLTLEYKKNLLEEVLICTKHLGLSYGDIMKMPTYERRFFIVTLQNQLVKAENEKGSKATVTKTGKHTQVRRFSPS